MLDVLPGFCIAPLLDVHRDHLHLEAASIAALSRVKSLHMFLQFARNFPARHAPVRKEIEDNNTAGKVIQFYRLIAAELVEFKRSERHRRRGMQSSHAEN